MGIEGWQPIETAPATKRVLIFIPMADQPVNLPMGTHIIAYRTDFGEPFKESWRYATGTDRGRQCGWPTHWQPLPSPPKGDHP